MYSYIFYKREFIILFMSTISSIREFLGVSLSNQHMSFYIPLLLHILKGRMERDLGNACSVIGFDICSMALN